MEKSWAKKLPELGKFPPVKNNKGNMHFPKKLIMRLVLLELVDPPPLYLPPVF